MLWFTRDRKTPCREEARMEIDLERASLRREVQYQKDLREAKAKVEAIENKVEDESQDAEVKVMNEESMDMGKAVVAELDKGDKTTEKPKP